MLTVTTPGPNLVTQGARLIGSFSLVQDQHMFNVLSSGLYTRKIEAPIRELCSNAFDTHQRTGQTKPFTVTLPTISDPRFMVQDFGAGMPKVMLHELFPAYGWTDKRTIAQEIGGFGLGAKSPMAYLTSTKSRVVRPFTVESVHQGLLNIIVCSLDEHRMPVVMSLAEDVPTDRPQGTLVYFTVDEDDIPAFQSVASQVLYFFDKQPTIVNGTPPPDRVCRQVGSAKLLESPRGLLKGARIVIANVSYPVSAVFMKNDSLLLSWVKAGVHVYRDSGPRIMSPSREALEETDEAINFVHASFKEEALAAHQHVIDLYRSLEGKSPLDKMVAIRQLVVDQELTVFPFSHAYFLKQGASDYEATLFTKVTAKEYTPALELPEALIAAAQAGVSITHLASSFVTQPTGIKYYVDQLALDKDAKHTPKPHWSTRRRRSNEDNKPVAFRLPIARGRNGVAAASHVRFIVADNSKYARQARSLLTREMVDFHMAFKEAEAKGVALENSFNYPATMLLKPPRDMSVETVLAMVEEVRGSIGFNSAEVVLASSVPIMESFRTKKEKAPPVDPASFRVRGKQELFVSPPDDGEDMPPGEFWPGVILVTPEVLNRDKTAAVYQRVHNLSWRRGEASTFSINRWDSNAGGVSASASKLDIAFRLCGATRPGVLWAGTEAVSKGCENAGMVPLEQCLLETLQGYLATKPTLLKQIAWLQSQLSKIISGNSYSDAAKEAGYFFAFYRSSADIHEFYQSVANTPGGRALAKLMPSIKEAENAHFEKEDVRALQRTYTHFRATGWETTKKYSALDMNGFPQSEEDSIHQIRQVLDMPNKACPELVPFVRNFPTTTFQKHGLELLGALMRDKKLRAKQAVTA